jgi:hypothetical protein
VMVDQRMKQWLTRAEHSQKPGAQKKKTTNPKNSAGVTDPIRTEVPSDSQR